MYAVIKPAGNNIRVSAGEKQSVEQIPPDIGATITFSEVLAVGVGADVVFGAPSSQGRKSITTVIEHGKVTRFASSRCVGAKTIARAWGHRQGYTRKFSSRQSRRRRQRTRQGRSGCRQLTGSQSWLCHKKAAAQRATVAIPNRNAWASSPTVAS